jgi:trimethylamine:corrinoid methyltransferase-like protein
LSEDEQSKVHEKSIKILEEIGVKFLSAKALKVLEKNGAKVDFSEKLARIPREMVDQALKTAPKSFVLGARNPEFDVPYPAPYTGYVLDCGGVFTFDYIQGPGAIETSGTLCLEQIVVDEEIAILCKRLRDGIDTSDEKDFYDDIKAVGPGGHFLMQPNTVKACRSEEFLMPLLSNRSAYESWVKLGSPELYQKAQQKVEEILATPQKHPLPDDVIGKLEAIIRRAEEELE